ncbi:MAG: poly(3-hydroxyalkanoate) depolymerase [Dehalococcoidia bacterium]
MQATMPGETVEMVSVNGYALRVATRRGRSEGGVPLLLFNGLGASLETFAPFVEALSLERTVIRFDAPGVGLSSPPRRPYRLWALAWLTGRLLDALGHRSVDVLGLSWGGLAAQQFALQLPRRCERLILASTCPGMVAPGPLDALVKLSDPRRHTDPEYLTRIAGDTYGGEIRRRPELSGVLAEGRHPDPVGYRYQQLAAVGWLSLPFLPLLCQPTLVVSGTDDPLIPELNARLLASLIPKAALHLFEDGHLGLMTRANEVAPVIEAFLNNGRDVAGAGSGVAL